MALIDGFATPFQEGALLAGFGSVLASGSTLVPTNKFHRVTGISVISTITPPAGVIDGEILFLVMSGLLSLGTGGNLGAAITAIVGRVAVLVWSATDNLWYPVL